MNLWGAYPGRDAERRILLTPYDPDVEAGLAVAALARARRRWHVEPESDPATLAAAYAFGLAKAHPFNDGNKRIAFLAAMIFLGLNGRDLDVTEPEVVQVVVALAAGSFDEADRATWMRGRVTRLRL